MGVPKPPALKKLIGSDRADRDALFRVIDSPSQRPDPPADLGENGVRIWNDSLDYMMQYNVYQNFDYDALGIYCREVEQYYEAIYNLKHNGDVNYAATGQPHPNTVKNQCILNIKMLRIALGLSYDIRSKALLSEKPDPKKRKLDSLIKKTG